MAFRNVCGRSE